MGTDSMGEVKKLSYQGNIQDAETIEILKAKLRIRRRPFVPRDSAKGAVGGACVRCGQCCISVGRTFWSCGDFENYPELAKLAEQTESKDEGLPCQMLEIKDSIATCRIERDYGYTAKPKVCQEYPTTDISCGLCWYYLMG